MVKIEVFENYIEVNGYKIYINKNLTPELMDEDALQQFVNIHKLPGLKGAIGLPDFHAGYYFPIGSVAAIDLKDPEAVISPEGVGFDINCGVRCLKTNLKLEDIEEKRDEIADMLFASILSPKDSYHPIITLDNLNKILERGLAYLFEKGEISSEEIEHTESRGSLPGNSRIVDQKSKSRGMSQIGSLGSGNHYLEVQVVESILDREKAETIGIEERQILISIHTGSRGLGHCVCSNFLKTVNKEEINKSLYANLKKQTSSPETAHEKKNPEEEEKEHLRTSNDTLYVPYNSQNGKKYMELMSSAANFAWANRAVLTQNTRRVFEKIFPAVKIEVVSDISHNIAKIEKIEDTAEILVHRKGASRTLPPNHPELPSKYFSIGLPVLVGGSMGTSSFLVTGADGCTKTFYSCPHGAGRLIPRKKANKVFEYAAVLEDLKNKGITVRCDSKTGLVEESGDCYKDIEQVIGHSEKIGLVCAVAKLKPIIVIKGD